MFEDPVEVGSRDRIAKVYIREMAWPGNLKMVLHMIICMVILLLPIYKQHVFICANSHDVQSFTPGIYLEV